MTVPVPAKSTSDPQREWESLQNAIDKTRNQIQKTQITLSHRVDQQAVDIFDAHLLFLDDEALGTPARQGIFENRLDAATSWQNAVESLTAQYKAMDDEYFRARATDVVDVGRQVLTNLLGQTLAVPELTEPGILIAVDLTPSETVHLDPTFVLGICTANGGPTSHSAILARALGIPAIVGVGEAILGVNQGISLILNGDTGQLILDPDAATVARYKSESEVREYAEKEAQLSSANPAITSDGRRIEVAANIGSVTDALGAVASGADAVGLFRTEFLFLNRATEPDEEEQYIAYRAVAEALAGRSLIIRTLDVGGDKPLAYIDQGQEANPFLGWRAIRLCLAQPEFFKVQLRAIVRVAADFPVKIMFPMIATQTELRAAKVLLEDAFSEVRQSGGKVPDRLDVGMMVEIPASALQADRFAPEVDFFSIGTNDLIQYTLAAERGNPRLAALTDGFQPAVLQLIRQVVEAAHAHGKWVGVCGELAGDPLAVALLCGLGVDELSMSAPAIPRVKQLIRGLDYLASVDTATILLTLDTPQAIREALTAQTQVGL
jgi:phosphocarrier protein FPr